MPPPHRCYWCGQAETPPDLTELTGWGSGEVLPPPNPFYWAPRPLGGHHSSIKRLTRRLSGPPNLPRDGHVVWLVDSVDPVRLSESGHFGVGTHADSLG